MAGRPARSGTASSPHRSAAALFALAGVLALFGIAQPHSRPRDLAIVAVADALVAAAARWLPWPRLPRLSTLAIAVAGLVVLAFATWAFGGQATGTGPFFVLLFAWLGLHHPPWTAVALLPLTAAAYVAPLIVTRQPPEIVGSAVIFVPVTTAVAMVIAGRVGQLHRARAEVEEAGRWRAALMATLAHDVRSPLTSVTMALGVLEDGALSEAQRHRFIGNALRQVDRVSRLASGLLDASRVEHGSLVLERSAVPLRDAAELAVSLLPASAGARVLIDEGVTAYADPQRLEQMLVNLIGNAARHGAAPIDVTAEVSAEAVSLAVRDHGPGVPDAIRERLFDRFTGGGAAGSVGLGLWIVRELARAHGGEARYEPADPGARFVITLPAAP